MSGSLGELTYRGQPIQAWIERLQHADAAERQAAAEALLQIGRGLTDLVPVLGTVQRQLDPERRAPAVLNLGQVGARLQGAVLALHGTVKRLALTESDEAVHTSALQALTLLGPQPRSQVAPLVEALREDLADIRSGAAQALGQLGPEAREAVPALTSALLHDGDFHVRVEAAVAIWRIDKRAGRVLPTLVQALQANDEVLRWTAAECLGEMGADAREAVPALLEALKANYKTRLIHRGIHLALERIDAVAARRVVSGE